MYIHIYSTQPDLEDFTPVFPQTVTECLILYHQYVSMYSTVYTWPDLEDFRGRDETGEGRGDSGSKYPSSHYGRPHGHQSHHLQPHVTVTLTCLCYCKIV